MWPFKRKEPETETRSSGTGYTAQIMQARADYITGVDGVAELTGTVQGCVSLWEGGLSLADVVGTDLLTPAMLALGKRACMDCAGQGRKACIGGHISGWFPRSTD